MIKTDDLRLVVPEYQELWYRKHLMEDPETMSFTRLSDCAGLLTMGKMSN